MKFHSRESKAFSKSSRTKSPGIFSLFVFSIKSNTNLLQSRMYLPLMKLDCDSEISLLKTVLILAAIAEEPILRSTGKSEPIFQVFFTFTFFRNTVDNSLLLCNREILGCVCII